MTATGLPWRRLLRFVASRRSCVCPNQGFQAQLQQYQDGACSNATKKLHEKYPEGASLVQEIIKEIEQFEEEVQGRMAGEGGGTQVDEEEESHPPTGLFETRAQLSSETYVPPHRRRPPPGGDNGTLGDDSPLLPAPGQGVGAALLQDGRRALRAGFAREGDFALEQEEKVRAQLRPLKAAGAQAGGHMGLEWLDKRGEGEEGVPSGAAAVAGAEGGAPRSSAAAAGAGAGGGEERAGAGHLAGEEAA